MALENLHRDDFEAGELESLRKVYYAVCKVMDALISLKGCCQDFNAFNELDNPDFLDDLNISTYSVDNDYWHYDNLRYELSNFFERIDNE